MRDKTRRERISSLAFGAGLPVTALLCALCLSAEAQQLKKIPRIGYLSPLDPPTDSARSEEIRLTLRELGYIEDQNIAIVYRYAKGKVDHLPELAAELVRLKVDIIVAVGDRAVCCGLPPCPDQAAVWAGADTGTSAATTAADRQRVMAWSPRRASRATWSEATLPPPPRGGNARPPDRVS